MSSLLSLSVGEGLSFLWYITGIYILPFLFALSAAYAAFGMMRAAATSQSRAGQAGFSFSAAAVVVFAVWVVNGVQGSPLGIDVESALLRPMTPVPALGAFVLVGSGFYLLTTRLRPFLILALAGFMVGVGLAGLHLSDMSTALITHMIDSVVAGEMAHLDLPVLPAFGAGVLGAVAFNRALFSPLGIGTNEGARWGRSRLFGDLGTALLAAGILFSPYFTPLSQLTDVSGTDFALGLRLESLANGADFLGHAAGYGAASLVILLIASQVRRVHAHLCADKVRFDSLIELSSNAVMTVRGAAITFINPVGRRLLAIPDTMAMTETPIRDFLHPDYVSLFEENAGTLSDLAAWSEKLPIILKNHQGQNVETSMSVAQIDRADQAQLSDGADFLLEFSDQTAQKQGALKVIAREQRLRAIMDNVADGIITMDRDGTVNSLNSAAVRIFSCAPDYMIGKSLAAMISDDFDPTQVGRVEVTARRGDGILFFLDMTISEMTAGMQQSLIATVRDVTDKKQAEAQTLHFANHDLVTDLPNRISLQTKIGDAVRKVDIGSVFYIGVERIRSVVDTLGHDVGEELLRAIAERLKESIGPAGTVGVWNSGEYVIIVPGMIKRFEIECLAAGILKKVTRPFMVRDHEIIVGASVGVSTFPKDGLAAYHLVRNAAMAQNQAAAVEASSCHFFSSEMTEKAAARHRLENDLRHAVELGELCVFYQPKMDLASGEVAGMEALLRWNHPGLGLVSPADFIPIAEETGLIVPIGAWVLEESCRQTMAWKEAGFEGLSLAVNLSGRQFEDENLLDTIRGALLSTGLSPSDLELEVTESSLIGDIEAGLRVLEEIRKMGISIAIDDFGTGYSSLGHLKFMPLDTLKIDQSFVRHVPDDEDGSVIVSTIAAMAHSLGFKVVAEGIETVEQEGFLKSLGCDMGQGFFYSRPLAADGFEAFLNDKMEPWKKSLSGGAPIDMTSDRVSTLLLHLPKHPKTPRVPSSLQNRLPRRGTKPSRRDTPKGAQPRRPLLLQ